MKNLTASILFLFFLSITSPVLSQISIGQSDMPSSGDTIRYSNASLQSLSFDAALTGPQYAWDFSALVAVSQGLFEYKSSFQTPYLLYFFNTLGLKTADSINLGVVSLDDIYSFYTKNSTVFKAEGQGYSISGFPLGVFYANEDEIYQFPLQYNDQDTSDWYIDYDLSAITTLVDYAQTGVRVNHADGWGSLITPYGTFPSTLRVKTTLQITDTLVISGFPLPVSRTEVSYKWLNNTEKIPLLEISGLQTGSTFTPTAVRYRDNFIVNVGLDGISALPFTVFPNPASGELNFSPLNEEYDYMICNAEGKRMASGTLPRQTTQLPLDGLPDGSYILLLSDSGNQRFFHRFQRIN